MTTKTLSQPALSVIDAYKNLQIGNVTIPCLYYINKRQKIRAGLRVSIGKGSPLDILDEVDILALKNKLDITQMDEDTVRAFLQKHNIGIDCSAFTYYVLNAEVQSQTGKGLHSFLSFPYTKSIFRKLLIKLRTVENTNVRTLAHEKNSKEILLPDVSPGDMITILESGKNNDFYHVMVVSSVEYSKKGRPLTMHYTHSFQWSIDGKYHHGVREGYITVTDVQKPLLEQEWYEQGKTGKENETFMRAKEANTVSLRRLHCLS